jgi:glycosyltransferase involved in cell wall biosynthesis
MKVLQKLLGRAFLLPLPHAWKEIRDCTPVVAHYHFGHWAALNLRVPRGLSIPLVCQFYGADACVVSLVNYLRPLYRELASRVDVLLAEGPSMKARLVALGFPEHKVHLHPIPIPISEYRFRERRWDGTRPVVFLFIGRMVPKKGPLLLLEALGSWRFTNWKLIMVGDGPLLPEAKAAAIDRKIRDRVEFAGYKPYAEVREMLSAADVLVQPSRTDVTGDGEGGAPTIVLEAQASGIPIVGTTHDDIPWVTVPGESAVIAEEGSTEALVNALGEIVSRAPQWPDMGRRGREKVMSSHDAPALAETLQGIYDRLR